MPHDAQRSKTQVVSPLLEPHATRRLSANPGWARRDQRLGNGVSNVSVSSNGYNDQRTMNIAVIFAGGLGARLSGSVAQPKQFLAVHGKPIIIHTLEHFESHPEIDAIAMAIPPSHRADVEQLLSRYEVTKLRWIVNGGGTGQISRHRALLAVADECPPESVVLVHDGVRPLIDAKLISDNIQSVLEHGSGITCTKIHETVVTSATLRIDDVIPREHIYAAQAPQSFRLGEILGLYERAATEGHTDSIDSCSLMRRYQREVFRVNGPGSNIKITTSEDVSLYKALLEVLRSH